MKIHKSSTEWSYDFDVVLLSLNRLAPKRYFYM